MPYKFKEEEINSIREVYFVLDAVLEFQNNIPDAEMPTKEVVKRAVGIISKIAFPRTNMYQKSPPENLSDHHII